MDEHQATKEGVAEAFDFWLSQQMVDLHPDCVPNPPEGGLVDEPS